MADTAGQADIRGINIDTVVKGFAEEEIVMKRFVTVTPTSAREIRWYQKTAGFLGGTTTSGITSDNIANVAEKARPTVINQTFTRNTSYIRKYFVESEIISEEDIKDNDVDILLNYVRNLTRAVEHQVDTRIWNVLTENQSATNINSVTSNAAWDAGSGQDPIEDLMDCKLQIRTYSYDPEGAVLMLSPKDHKSLVTWLISTKGSSIPAFASARLGDGVVMEILGLRVVVSTIVTADYAAVFIPQRACTWKSFMPITAVTIEDKGIGRKIRIWEEGEAILTDPRAVCLLTNTQA